MLNGEKRINVKAKFTEKADFNLRKYAVNNNFRNKGEALNHLLENYGFVEEERKNGKVKVKK